MVKTTHTLNDVLLCYTYLFFFLQVYNQQKITMECVLQVCFLLSASRHRAKLALRAYFFVDCIHKKQNRKSGNIVERFWFYSLRRLTCLILLGVSPHRILEHSVILLTCYLFPVLIGMFILCSILLSYFNNLYFLVIIKHFMQQQRSVDLM